MQKKMYKYLTSTSRAEASNGLRLNSAALAAVIAAIVACLVNFGEIRARIIHLIWKVPTITFGKSGVSSIMYMCQMDYCSSSRREVWTGGLTR